VSKREKSHERKKGTNKGDDQRMTALQMYIFEILHANTRKKGGRKEGNRNRKRE